MNLTAEEVEAAIKAANRMRKGLGRFWITTCNDNKEAEFCSKDEMFHYG